MTQPIRWKVFLALVIYHSLILLGAYFLLVVPALNWIIGAALVGAGILLDLGLIIWTLRRALFSGNGAAGSGTLARDGAPGGARKW